MTAFDITDDDLRAEDDKHVKTHKAKAVTKLAALRRLAKPKLIANAEDPDVDAALEILQNGLAAFLSGRGAMSEATGVATPGETITAVHADKTEEPLHASNPAHVARAQQLKQVGNYTEGFDASGRAVLLAPAPTKTLNGNGEDTDREVPIYQGPEKTPNMISIKEGRSKPTQYEELKNADGVYGYRRISGGKPQGSRRSWYTRGTPPA